MVSSSSYYAALAAGILLATSSSTSTSSTSIILLPGCHAFVPASTNHRKSSAIVNRDILKPPVVGGGVPAPSPIASANHLHLQHIPPTVLHANPAGRTPGHDPPEGEVQDISETTQTALDKYGIDFTARASEGKLDPGAFFCFHFSAYKMQRATSLVWECILTLLSLTPCSLSHSLN